MLNRARPTASLDLRRRVPALAWGTFLVLLVSGCATSLGYVRENIRDKDIGDKTRLVPSYTEVKIWARAVQDAYDSRATANRYAQYFGALLGTAAASALVGLAAFDSGSSAIAGIPLGTGFLAGTAGIFSNDHRAAIYGKASVLIKRLVNLSDERMTAFNGYDAATKQLVVKPEVDASEARCLKNHVDEVMAHVDAHIRMSTPQNLVNALTAVAPQSVEKVNKLIAAARGDLSDLDPDPDLRTRYCAESGQVLAVEDALGLDPKYAGGHLEHASQLVTKVARLRGDLRTALNGAEKPDDLLTLAGQRFSTDKKKQDAAKAQIDALRSAITSAEGVQAKESKASVDAVVEARDKLGVARNATTPNSATISTAIAELAAQTRVLENLSSDLETKTTALRKASTAARQAVEADQ